MVMTRRRTQVYMPLENPTGLTNLEIERMYPTIFTDHAAPTMSARYNYYGTRQLHEGMLAMDLVPTSVSVQRTRKEGWEPYVMHVIWYTHRASLGQLGHVNAKVHRIMLKNSYGGGSSLEAQSGLWVKVCSNGLTIGDVDSSIRIRHMGNVGDVYVAVQEIVASAPFALGAAELMEQVKLDRDDIELMGQFLLAARFNVNPDNTQVVDGEFRVLDEHKQVQKAVEIAQFSYARHPEQRENTLFNVANRYEEGLRRGGQEVESTVENVETGKVQHKQRKARAVTGIQQTLSHQGLIWKFSEALYKSKTGKELREVVLP